MWHSPDVGDGSCLDRATAVILNPPSARHATRNSAEICRFCAFRRPQTAHADAGGTRGYQIAVQAAGQSCHVFLEEDATGNRESERGDLPLEQWVRGLPKPIGVMASTDGRALHLLAVCRKRAIPVPKSVAVVGVDNDDVFCELATPPLSSIALSTQRIGYEAARMLDRLMAGNKLTEKQLLVPPAGLVPRQSSDLPSLLDADVAAAVR